MHYWVPSTSADFAGSLPQPRSGHTAVLIGQSKLVVFGGLIDKKFLADVVVYDIENKLWFHPQCSGSGSDGQVAPNARSFHIAVAIDCHMFIFGGRCGSKRLGDFWVLDTDIWQWSELTSFGDLPSPRDFSSASAIGNRKIVMYGGWDGKKWLSDVYVLDTMSLEWMELAVSGTVPPARCGHTGTMVEKRLLVYGGRGGGGPIMSDLWALKGLIDEELETPGWTQLKLPGQAPTPRCGHTVTSGGHYLLLFGGHGTAGWLSRYDVYHNDCIVLDRVSAQWRRLPTSNEPPPARAYHSMTCIGSRYLLFGGFDGQSTFGDIWWLVQEDDPIAKRTVTSPPKSLSEKNNVATANYSLQAGHKEEVQEDAISELQKRLDIAVAVSRSGHRVVDELEDKEFLELASGFIGDKVFNIPQAIQALRDRWRNCEPTLIQLKELGALLRDYQRLISRHHLSGDGTGLQFFESGSPGKETYRFYHIKNSSQLRMDDIPKLLSEYRMVPHD